MQTISTDGMHIGFQTNVIQFIATKKVNIKWNILRKVNAILIMFCGYCYMSILLMQKLAMHVKKRHSG